jgi:hypothetical protein
MLVILLYFLKRFSLTYNCQEKAVNFIRNHVVSLKYYDTIWRLVNTNYYLTHVHMSYVPPLIPN